jgi:phenylalanyl-tRNA synthetase beta chain
MNSKTTFSEIRSYVQAFMREIDVEWKAEESEDGAFIIGRQAKVIVNGKSVGVFGEVHPRVLESFGIIYPVVAFEIDLTQIFDCGEIL